MDLPSPLRRAVAGRAEYFMRRELRALGATPFSIIANDCWGGEVYRLADRPYTTPFVGLFVLMPCYLAILENLDAALGSDLEQIEHSRYAEYATPAYPLGRLSTIDAEIHFLHYRSFAEAREKWQRRAARVDRDALFVKAVPGDASELARFRALSYGQSLMSSPVPVPHINTALSDGLADAVLDFRSSAGRFDVADWLAGGTGQIPAGQRAWRRLRYAGWAGRA